MPRYAAKNDDNQKEIVKDLRKMGISVETGHDDILVGYKGQTRWYEIKNKNGRNRLQESQTTLLSTWKGHYKVVHTLDDILKDLNIL